jgi:hypothetical protein
MGRIGSPWCALALGAISAIGCNLAVRLDDLVDGRASRVPDAAFTEDAAPDDAPRAPPTPRCTTFTSGTDLSVCAATYLGGSAEDRLDAVAIGEDGTIHVAGTLPEGDLGAPVTTLLDGGAGAIVRLGAKGTKVLGVTRIGSSVTDLALGEGRIAVASDRGVVVVDREGSTVLWNKGVGAQPRRIALGSDGTVAAIAGGEVHLFDPRGAAIGRFDPKVNDLADVAVDGAKKRVIVTGTIVRDGTCKQLRIAFVRAYAYDGTLAWRAWDFDNAAIAARSLCAGTSGARVEIGADGELYFAGTSSGGNSILARDPQDLAKSAPTVGADAHSAMWGTRAENSTFVARLSLETGAIAVARWVVARLPTDQGNTVEPTAIAAAADGTFYLGGYAACCIAARDGDPANTKTTLAISGQKVGPFANADGFALILSPDFTKRLSWSTWTGTGAAPVTGIATGAGLAAIVATQPAISNGALLTEAALFEGRLGGADGFVSVWPAP